MSRWKSSLAILAAALGFGAEGVPPAVNPAKTLVAHEWGTFTSVADADGNPVPWQAYTGPTELPCFVHNSGGISAKLNGYATVRMETPVIYFYAPTRTTVSVQVDLPGGLFSEWYPEASEFGFNRIQWQSVEVLPGEVLNFPTGQTANHYYTARATDSAPLRAGNEQEKMIFYRGLANFFVPLRAKFIQGKKLQVENAGSGVISKAIVFENRGGKVGYRVINNLHGRLEVERPELTGDVASLRLDLANYLTEAGLYRKEAEAMVETWRESWFEEGTRVFYVFPPAAVDAVLPLAIRPRPEEIERVFVGRVELLSPEAEEELVSARDPAVLARYGRFLQPFWEQIRQRRHLPAANFAHFDPVSCAK
jgi:hypothetical protein